MSAEAPESLREALDAVVARELRGPGAARLRPVTQRTLDWNRRPGAWMRAPQLQAFERYVALRELRDAPTLKELARALGAPTAPLPEVAWLDPVFALAMGTGKTLLMATCLLWELLVAACDPEDTRCARNALVLAPDRTVLDSLLAIQRFDRGLVLPPELRPRLERRLRFHALVEPGATLDALDGSSFNVVVANVQKVALQRRQLAPSGPFTPAPAAQDLVGNQRFERLLRLPRLAVFVDEAHHTLGRTLERDLGVGEPSRLRQTLIALHEARPEGLSVSANFTGTPYARGQELPQVVYRYGLAEAVGAGLLKGLRVLSFSEPRSEGFVDQVIGDFLARHGAQEAEGLRPKLAFFAQDIGALEAELRPAVERALAARGVPLSEVLVNVGDPRLTRDEDLAAFRALDTPGCQKRFILLVNKGREGWDCRSLFGVALYRRPRSPVFVLQASLRCLRAIDTEGLAEGTAYVSPENAALLLAELRRHHGLATSSLTRSPVRVGAPRRTRPPAPPASLAAAPEWPAAAPTSLPDGLTLALRPRGVERVEHGLHGVVGRQALDTAQRGPRWSLLSLSAALAEALRCSPLEVDRALRSCSPGAEAVLAALYADPALLEAALLPQLRRALTNEARTP